MELISGQEIYLSYPRFIHASERILSASLASCQGAQDIGKGIHTMAIKISPDRQRPGESIQVRISGEEVDMSIRTIRLKHPAGNFYDRLVMRISETEVEITTGTDFIAGGYNVFGLDHSDKTKFEVTNGYLIS
jgi:hypothetical protein